jgi:hypothetical protein
LRCPSTIAHAGRVARRSAFAGKTSHAQESSNDGITRRNRCIRLACCGARDFTDSQARSQKSRGWHSSQSGCVACSHTQSKRQSQKSGDNNESFTVTWQILAWRSVQAEKFCGSQSGSRDRRRRKEHEY